MGQTDEKGDGGGGGGGGGGNDEAQTRTHIGGVICRARTHARRTHANITIMLYIKVYIFTCVIKCNWYVMGVCVYRYC